MKKGKQNSIKRGVIKFIIYSFIFSSNSWGQNIIINFENNKRIKNIVIDGKSYQLDECGKTLKINILGNNSDCLNIYIKIRNQTYTACILLKKTLCENENQILSIYGSRKNYHWRYYYCSGVTVNGHFLNEKMSKSRSAGFIILRNLKSQRQAFVMPN